MSHRIRPPAVLALVFSAGLTHSACSGTTPSGASPLGPTSVAPLLSEAPAERGRVIVVSIDGLRPDALPRAGTPNLMSLTAKGAFTWQARSIMPSSTLPAHVSMLSGVPPETHRVTWDEYQPWRGTIPAPALFVAARAGGLTTAMVVGKEKFGHFRDVAASDQWMLETRGDRDIAGRAAALAGFGVDLLFVHLPDVDVAGHASGWMSDGYLAAVRRADEALGVILGAIGPETTVIVTADHGGHTAGHGTDDPQDMTIPWIIAGPRTVAGRKIASPVRTVDTAATIAHVLGLRLPAQATGTPVLEAFTPGPAGLVAMPPVDPLTAARGFIR